jgi:hypothetical protein
LLAGVHDKERPCPLVHEIRRAARHVAGGLLVAQNIVTAVRDCIVGRGWSGFGPGRPVRRVP